jgi:serine/threonine-protein kinase
VFALEAKEILKNHIRDKFKDRGYRVLMSSDPEQALKRYQEQPYHALVVNAGSVGQEGLMAFNRVLKESDKVKLDLAAVLILDNKQADWKSDVITHVRGDVLFLPLKMKDLIDKVEELTPVLKTVDSDEQ